jgi:hypothetical protein
MKCPASSLAICVVSVFLFATQTWGAKPYKIYVINKYGAYDIVCDSYTVQKNDHIWDILRRRGSIAEEDFPRFVKILRDMNPSIKDVNTIYPKQKILIPLKEIPSRESRTAGGQRYITIPMIPDVLYKDHNVGAGECLSKIITAHIQVRWNQLSSSYFEAFRRLNPRITDLNLIYPGQTIRIPELPSSEAPETESISVASREDKRIQEAGPDEIQTEDKSEESLVAPSVDIPPAGESVRKPDDKEPSLETVATDLWQEESVVGAVAKTDRAFEMNEGPSQAFSELDRKRTSAKVLLKDGVNVITSEQAVGAPGWKRIVSMVATQIGGKLLSSGHCYFPGKGQQDVALDLAAFPVFELKNGRHILLEKDAILPENAEDIIRASWKGLLTLRADKEEADSVVLEKIFRAVYGQRIRKDLALPPMDDGIQVALRGDWILPGEQSRDQRPLYCVTLVENQDEGSSGAVVEYLKTKNIHVVDVLTTEKARNPLRPFHDEKSQRASVLLLDGSSAETFVAGFVRALGLLYEPQVPLSFEYAGFQVETTANIIYSRDGLDVVVDFGTFYGDAKAAIAAGGMNVLSINTGDGMFAIAERVLNALGSVYTKDPEFHAADRELSRMVSLAFPGYLISYEQGGKLLLPRKMVSPKLLEFFGAQQIGVLEVKTMLQSQS